MMTNFPKPNLKEFITNSGKYLALIKHPDEKSSNYMTMFVVENVNRAELEINNLLSDIGEVTTATWNYNRVDYFIANEGWYHLIDYSQGVVECKGE